MVHYATTLIGAAALMARLSLGAALPQNGLGDSALGLEVAVSAPDGIPITDTVELARQSAAEAATTAYPAASYVYSAPPVYVATTAAAAETPAEYSPVVYSSPAAYSPPVYSAPPVYTPPAVHTPPAVYSAPAVYSSSEVVHPPPVETVHETTSTLAAEATHPPPVYSAPPVVASTSVEHPPATTTVQYGSGAAPWKNEGYNDCVQQCVAKFGAPLADYTPPPSQVGEVGGAGATHTVIVAPSQGVLRYVPFAVNASVGDTVKFLWNANVHTVTKSDVLSLCNATADAPFASGRQNKSFVFTQVVNTTDPIFFHCAVPNHCQRGMFGIVNPPSALASANSVAQQMQQVIAANPELAAIFSYADKVTGDNRAAKNWGGSIDTTGWPDWTKPLVAENVLYSRTFLAANPEVLGDDGKIDLGAAGDAPLLIPQDLSVALAANSPASSAPAGTDAPAAPTTGTTAGQTNGARGMASSSALAGVIALITAFYVL